MLKLSSYVLTYCLKRNIGLNQSTKKFECGAKKRVERGGSIATIRNLGEKHENTNNNSNSGISDSSPSKGLVIAKESVSENISRGNFESRESETKNLLYSGPSSLSSNDMSSSTGDISSQEARRNSQRRLWDALTRATSRRRTLAPAILLSTKDIDGLGS